MTAVPQNQISISRRTLDIEDYIDIARRHVSWIVGPLYAGIVIATVIAFFLPNTYVSRAMLRITQSQIPDSLVPATFNQQMSDRINQMWQEVQSRSSLSELIQRPNLDLYKSQRNNKPMEDVIEDMKKDIRIEIINMNAGNTGNKPNSAFYVTFNYPDRNKAHDVVAALVTKLMDANQVAQHANVTQTNDLITDEVKEAKDALDKLDAEVTTFKMANQGRLPEELQSNLATLTALDTRMSAISDALQRNADQTLMANQQLTSLKAQYAQLESALATPPIEEANAARVATEKGEEIGQLKHEINLEEAQLAVFQQNLTDKHPDIIDLKAKLEALKTRRDQLVKEDDAARALAAAEAAKTKSAVAKKPMSLQNQQTLSQLKASIEATNAGLTTLEMDKVDLQAKQQKLNADMQGIETKIQASPINEQKYVQMTRQRAVMAEHYESMVRRQQLAQQGVEVNQRKAGESLDVLDPASLPETPTAPNRWQIVAIGAVVGLLTGFAMAGVKEMKDTSLKNLKDVRAYTNLPVLSSIPLLENALLVRRKRRLAYVAWAVAVIVGLCGVAISLYYHYQVSSK